MPKVNTDRYVNSHGIHPRGRGQWIFTVEHEGSSGDLQASLTIRSKPNQSYTEAKQYATRKAREFGWNRFRMFVEP